MAQDITHDDQNSPSQLQDVAAQGNGNGDLPDNRGIKRPRPSAAQDDDDDDDDKPGRERRKIEIKFIQDKSRRHITFSKRKAGIMKKAYELSVLTGTQVLLLVVSETGLVYTFTTPKLQPLVTKPEGKNLIQNCLNAPEPASGNENGVEPPDVEPEEQHPVPPNNMQRGPANPAGMAPGYGMPGGSMGAGGGMTPADLQYAYLQQSQGQGYGIPPARMGGHHAAGGDFK